MFNAFLEPCYCCGVGSNENRVVAAVALSGTIPLASPKVTGYSIRRQQVAPLLCDRSLVAHGLPMTGVAHPNSGIAIGTAEVLSELVTLYVGPGRHDGGVAIEANHHVADIDGVIAQLGAPARGYGFLLRGDLPQGGNRHVVVGESALRKLGIASKACFLRLALHLYDLANGLLIAGIDRGPGTNGYVLAGKSWYR